MNHRKSRIELSDSGMDMIMKLSDGNPGAVTVLIRCLSEGAAIDPASAFGGLSAFISLDSHCIYGSDIWVLYKDICGQDLVAMLGLLRAVQLGYMSESDLGRAIGRNHLDEDVKAEMLSKVRHRLPAFGIKAESEATA